MSLKMDWVESACTLYFMLIFVGAGLSWMFLPALATHGRSIGELSTKDMEKYGRPLRLIAVLHKRTVSKRYFLCFYATATCMQALLIQNALPLSLESAPSRFIEMTQKYPFIVHTVRRWIETYLYTSNTRSRMTLLQLFQGILYYCALSVHMCRSQHRIWMPTFLAANIMQGVAHYWIYRLRMREFHHYYCEILLYLIVLWHMKSLCMLFNLLYVILFVGMTISNRGGL